MASVEDISVAGGVGTIPARLYKPRGDDTLPLLVFLHGGGGVLAGMGTAAVAGLYLGFVQPASFLNLADALLNATQMDSLDLMPGIDALLDEAP